MTSSRSPVIIQSSGGAAGSPGANGPGARTRCCAPGTRPSAAKRAWRARTGRRGCAMPRRWPGRTRGSPNRARSACTARRYAGADCVPAISSGGRKRAGKRAVPALRSGWPRRSPMTASAAAGWMSALSWPIRRWACVTGTSRLTASKGARAGPGCPTCGSAGSSRQTSRFRSATTMRPGSAAGALPLPRPGTVNLRGLAPLARAEIQWGLHAHAQAASMPDGRWDGCRQSRTPAAA